MSFAATVKTQISVLGMLIDSSRSVSASGNASQRVDLPAGQEGTIADGTVTLSEGHGIETADVVDVYWGTDSLRTDCTVGTVDGNDVPLTGGSGDALPTSGTVIVAPQVAIDLDFVGNLVELLAMTCASRCRLDLRDSISASLLDKNLPAGGAYVWDSGSADANPLAGVTVAEAVASNGATTAAELIVAILYDSDA